MPLGRRSQIAIAAGLATVVAVGVLARPIVSRAVSVARHVGTSKKTVEDRLVEFGPAVDARLKPLFRSRSVAYPPQRIALVGLKTERILEVYAGNDSQSWKYIKSYPILAASGTPGPKLREGDGQVPEGIYAIESLNPNSLYHLSLRVNYPNQFDRMQARVDGRANLGGDIMIHGKTASIGCLAMGDIAAEDLFVLAARTGIDKITVILSPVDFRKRELPPLRGERPHWVNALYRDLREQLSAYPNSPS